MCVCVCVCLHRQGRPYQPVPTIISENLDKVAIKQIACASRDNLVGIHIDIRMLGVTIAMHLWLMQALSSSGTVFAWGSNAGAMRNDQPHIQRETEDGEPFQATPQIVAGALADQVVLETGVRSLRLSLPSFWPLSTLGLHLRRRWFK